MTNPYSPPPAPRRLMRSRNNRVVGGVCGGIAEYTNMDPTLVRVLTVLISFLAGGWPVIVYLIALFVIPEEEPGQGRQDYPPVNSGWSYGAYPQYPHQAGERGSDLPAYPPAPSPQAAPRPYGQASAPGDEAIWGQEGAPWEQRQPSPEPEQTSTWESAPADPDARPDQPGQRPA